MDNDDPHTSRGSGSTTEGPPHSDAPENSRSPARRPSPPDLSELRDRAELLENELARLYRNLFEARRVATGVGGAAPTASAVKLELRFRGQEALSTRPSPVTSLVERIEPTLFEQLRRAAESHADRLATFPSGRVYCYWSRSFEVAASQPNSPRSIFGGYGPTGQPLWPELTSVLLERRDPRIELIYRERPTPVTIVQSSRELLQDQLATYGRRSSVYRILGQVALGYLIAPARDGRPREPFAVTLQAVQGGDPSSPIYLNVLGMLSDGTPAHEVLEETADRVWEAVVKARRRLAEIRLEGLSRRQRDREKTSQVMDTLRKLSRQLERVLRQRTRRTRHSRDRHRNATRPSSKALEDALQARDDSIFRDVEEQTWIVLGPKSRVHVFNDGGAHITSVVYPGETVRHRTTRGKWRPPRATDLEDFRRALESTARADSA